MTAKYTVDRDDTARRWESDKRYVLHQWTDKPFHGHRHRHERVEHRIVVEYTPGVGLDVHHEARSDDTANVPDEWTAIESIEGRQSYARHDRRPQIRRWLK